MKTCIAIGITWLLLAAVRIPQVESWSFLSDGTDGHWWNLVGIRLIIVGLFFEMAYLRRRLSKQDKMAFKIGRDYGTD